MTVTDYLRSRPWLMRCLLAMLACYALVSLLSRPGSPVHVIGISVDKQIVAAGEDVAVTYDFVRERLCRTVVSSYWENESGKRVMLFPPASRQSATLGRVTATNSFQAPLIPGRMCLNTDVHHYCEDGTYEISMPDACVLVVAKVTP